MRKARSSVSAHRPNRGRNTQASRQLPDSVEPDADLLALQRTAGNGAIGRLLTGRSPIQRLVISNKKAVTTTSWEDKVKEQAKADNDTYDQKEVVIALASYTGQPVETLVTDHTTDNAISAALVNSQSKWGFPADVADEDTVHFYDHTLKKDWKTTKPLLAPDLVWTGKDDLKKDQYNADYVCVLISLLKVKGYDALKKKYGLKPANGETDQLTALHKEIYAQRGIRYDDWSGHIPLYEDNGLTFHSERTTWGQAHKSVDMAAGDYIFAIPGHMLAVKVTEDLTKKKTTDGKSAWYKSYSSIVQSTYARTFDADQKIDYVFKA